VRIKEAKRLSPRRRFAYTYDAWIVVFSCLLPAASPTILSGDVVSGLLTRAANPGDIRTNQEDHRFSKGQINRTEILKMIEACNR